MRHVAWCPWHGMIKLLWKGNDIPTDLQSKTNCLARMRQPSFSFSTEQKKKSSSIHLRDTVWKVKPKCFRNGTQRLYFGLGPRTFYFGLRPRFHVWQSKRHSRNQKRFFVTLGSTRDTIKVHIFLIFSKRFTVCFTMVIKWSPGGESGRQLRSPPV